jgi:hypothetical protein
MEFILKRTLTIKILFNGLIIALAFLFVTSCEVEYIDMRHSYSGNFIYDYSFSSWNENTGNYENGNGIFEGTAKYENNGYILFNYAQNASLRLVIDNYGILYTDCGEEVGSFGHLGCFNLFYNRQNCTNDTTLNNWSVSLYGSRIEDNHIH